MLPPRFLEHALLLLCLLPPALAETAVRHLSSKAELDIEIRRHEAVMVNYGMTWCGHCKKMKPAYEQAAEFLQEHKILLATVDCAEDFTPNPMCEDIHSYPTLRVHRKSSDTFVVYSGGRKAEDFISYMTDGKFPKQPLSTSVSSTQANVQPTRIPSVPPANPQTSGTAPNIAVRRDQGASAVVKLALPGLTHVRKGDISSSAILEFDFSADGKHLMLNGELLALQVPDPSIPMALRAAQVEENWDISSISSSLLSENRRLLLHTGKFTEIEFDYELYAQGRDDPNIVYYNYHPIIYLNLIGARLPNKFGSNSSAPRDFLLDSLEQKIVEIQLDQLGPKSSDDPNRSYSIAQVHLRDRPENYRVPRPSDQSCSPWSWRCSDVGDPPWYRFVWRENFDAHGRIGCLRRKSILLKWEIIGLLGSLLHYTLEVIAFFFSPWLVLWIPLALAASWICGFKMGKRRLVAVVEDKKEKGGILG